MKNSYLFLVFLLLVTNTNAQVGINTENPKSTLHVQKRAELTFPDGIIPPRISGDSLKMKASAYQEAQNGAIVYVTSPVTNRDPLGEPKTQEVATTGFYVYDAYYTHPSNIKGV